MDTARVDMESYKGLLKKYISEQDESLLYGAEQMSKTFIQNNILPEEIISLHIQALSDIDPDLSEEILNSMNFLLETMIYYGLAHQEYQTLRENQYALRSEMEVAANMQNSLLATDKPDVKDLDIGVISRPAHQLNGDYYHFIQETKGSLGVAIADVVGKGVPAALCMSMIKYSMDVLEEELLLPEKTLKYLNRVVERNIVEGMFITMFYAQYFPENHEFRYASAGHEPGFFYDAKTDSFSEIKTEGLVLGVMPDNEYPGYSRTVEVGDMIVLLTDGVTECRRGDEFIKREEVLDVIRQYMHLSAQEMVDYVYKHFERLQDFQLRDDFTLMILKRDV